MIQWLGVFIRSCLMLPHFLHHTGGLPVLSLSRFLWASDRILLGRISMIFMMNSGIKL